MKLRKFLVPLAVVLGCVIVTVLSLLFLQIYSNINTEIKKNEIIARYIDNGRVHFARGTYDLAAENFRKALQLSPEDLTAKENLDSAIKMGDPAAWLTDHPADDGVRENLIAILLQKREWSQARAHATLFSGTNNATRCLRYIDQQEKVYRTTGATYERGGDSDPLQTELIREIGS